MLYKFLGSEDMFITVQQGSKLADFDISEFYDFDDLKQAIAQTINLDKPYLIPVFPERFMTQPYNIEDLEIFYDAMERLADDSNDQTSFHDRLSAYKAFYDSGWQGSKFNCILDEFSDRYLSSFATLSELRDHIESNFSDQYSQVIDQLPEVIRETLSYSAIVDYLMNDTYDYFVNCGFHLFYMEQSKTV